MATASNWTRRNFLKTTAIGAGGLAILGGCAGAHYLRGGKQGAAAFTIPFNTDWLVGEYAEGGNNIDFNEGDLQKVTLPHTVAPLSWRKWNPRDWEKEWIYRKHFTWDKQADDTRVFVDFGAGMTMADVFLNGQEIGRHFGGYLPFQFELSDALQEGDNLLSVQLDSRFAVNVPPNKMGRDSRSVDFWQPGGLYRTANLHVLPQAFIADVFAKPVNVLTANCQLELECTLDIKEVPDGPINLVAGLFDGKRKIKEISQTVSASAGKTTVSLTMDNLLNIHLWDTDDPHLYQVKATLFVGNKPVHDYIVRTGFREVRFTKKGFFLNGKRIQLFGVNRHQFYPFAGGAMPARVQRKDAEILKKELNCNMVRCSHYPQSEAFFDACDELGLMAWEEAAGWGSPLGDAVWKQRAVDDVANMVRRDRNHPSIIIWGARLNETPDDVALYTKTKELAYQLDGSRQTSGAMVGGLHDTRNFVQDVFSYNDYKKSKTPYGKWQPELLPPRTDFPYLVTEAVGTLSGPARYYRRIDPPAVLQGQAEAHARVHELAWADQRYCGVLAWSGFDYPSGNGNQYEGVKYTGVVDLFRELKPGASIYQAQVDPKIRPVIAPAFYWYLAEDTLAFLQEEEAMICSNCDRMELFIDDNHFISVTPDKKRFSHLPYAPSFVNFGKFNTDGNPELKIDGYIGNKKVITRLLSSDTSKDRLVLKADDDQLSADGVDTTRVSFRIADAYGTTRPYAKGELKFTLTGPGVLIGDNPFAFEETGGVGAIWIRSRASQPGTIHLQAGHFTGNQEIRIEATRPGK